MELEEAMVEAGLIATKYQISAEMLILKWRAQTILKRVKRWRQPRITDIVAFQLFLQNVKTQHQLRVVVVISTGTVARWSQFQTFSGLLLTPIASASKDMRYTVVGRHYEPRCIIAVVLVARRTFFLIQRRAWIDISIVDRITGWWRLSRA